LRRQIFGNSDEKVAESLVDHAWILAQKKELAQAEKRVEEALSILRRPPHPTKPLIEALWAAVWIQVYEGNDAAAEVLANEAFAIMRTTPEVEYQEGADILHTLADSNNRRGKFAEAVRLGREALAMHLKLVGTEHPETGWGHMILAKAF